ncbi:unnamed protein product [Phytophthora lilii]|uniref:Unnamed protein product n=1 Tax=Phytophthora lilii TaxID=2077276 RepID=A0A9W6Y9N5_9STRA|nr:unnamed protein product [Phytophthora lilii]
MLSTTTSETGWVDAPVPGFGKCQIRRTSLVPDLNVVANGTGISTLTITFDEDPAHDVLCDFLGTIGSSLQYLSLHVSAFQTSLLERIAAHCPKLLEIAVCTPAVEARFRLNDGKSRYRKPQSSNITHAQKPTVSPKQVC